MSTFIPIRSTRANARRAGGATGGARLRIGTATAAAGAGIGASVDSNCEVSGEVRDSSSVEASVEDGSSRADGGGIEREPP
jgi:hypothetical protein